MRILPTDSYSRKLLAFYGTCSLIVIGVVVWAFAQPGLCQ